VDNLPGFILRILKLVHDFNTKIVFLFDKISITGAEATIVADKVNNNDFLEVLDLCESLSGFSNFLTFLATLFDVGNLPFSIFNDLRSSLLMHFIVNCLYR
jgi:hypothetical protein